MKAFSLICLGFLIWTEILLEYAPCFCIFFAYAALTVDKCLCIRFVCLSVHTLTFVNILQMSWNLHMLFIFDTKWTVLKMLCMGLMVCQRDLGLVYREILASPEMKYKILAEAQSIIFFLFWFRPGPLRFKWF